MIRMPSYCITAFVVAVLFPALATADESEFDALSDNELAQQIEEMSRSIEERTNSPDAPEGWRKRLKVEAQLNLLRDKHHEELSQTRAGGPDANDPAVQAWGQTIEKLKERLTILERVDRIRKRNAGDKLFIERHAVLAKQAIKDTPRLKALDFDVMSFPRIDGSTSTQPLAMLITCHAFGVPTIWESKAERLEKPTTADWAIYLGAEPEAELLEYSLQAHATRPQGERLAIMINKLLATNASTHQAYLNLAEGRSDVGLLARGPMQEELDFAKKHGIEFEITPCALDAFVFLKNKDNPVKSLSIDQIRDIYSGKIKNWRQVGGPNESIKAFERDESSGSQQLMKALVMKGQAFAPKGQYEGSRSLIGYLMSHPYLELSTSEYGIGYSVYYYERYMLGSAHTETIAIDGVEPSPETIQSKKYPLLSDVYVVTRKGEPDSAAARLKAWLLSAEGQSVVQESGYVPVQLTR